MSDKKDIKKPETAAVKSNDKITEVISSEKAAEGNTAVKADAVKPADKKAKKVVKKEKKPGIFVRIGKKIKEVFSELKKVTWPTFPTVLKQTGVVIAVVLFFLIIIFGFDTLMSFLYSLLFPSA